MPTEPLRSEQIEFALRELLNDESKTIRNGFEMLKANYRAPNRKISGTELARAIGYKDVGPANIQYGKFAHQICELIPGYEPVTHFDGRPAWTTAICIDPGDKRWILRPETAEAIERLGLVETYKHRDALDDIAANKNIYEGLSAKDREAVVKARIGQGVFRERVINHWNGACAVTGCAEVNLLVASHIKPWCTCTFEEAMDVTNGLLLVPNLDAAFDKGVITFNDEGRIVVSPKLADIERKLLGIEEEMQLAHIYPNHREYLLFHRLNVFGKGV